MVRSCEQAVAAGLPGVAFTDHLDFTIWTDGDQIGTMDLDPHRYSRMHLLDSAGYLATLDDCRQRFPGLRILSGVEIGEAHLWAASAAATVAKAGPGGLDRILGSLHAIPHEGRLTAADELFRQMPAANVMRRYFAELLRLVEGSNLFQVLAHLDFPRRMWPRTAGPYQERTFEAEYRAVLSALAAGDRVLEVNTKGPLSRPDCCVGGGMRGDGRSRSAAMRTSPGGWATSSSWRSMWSRRRASGLAVTASTSGGSDPITLAPLGDSFPV